MRRDEVGTSDPVGAYYASSGERAAAELNRVLPYEGVVFVALVPRHAFLRRTLAVPDERQHLARPDFVARLLEDGVPINDRPGRFTGGYGVRPGMATHLLYGGRRSNS